MDSTPDNADAPRERFAPERGSVWARTLRVPLLWKLVLSNVALLSLVGLAVAVLEDDPAVDGRAALFTGLAVLTAGVVSFVMVRFALRPLEVLERTAERVGAGDVAARVPRSVLADPSLDRLGDTMNEMLDALERSRERQRELSIGGLRFQERDRGRMAESLYDRTAQTLAGVLVRIRVLDREDLSPACMEHLAVLREQIRGALEEVRTVARHLRPPELDELGTRAALEAHARELREAGGPEVTFQGAVPEDRMSADARLALFRVGQEALSNVARHARASRATVRFRTGESELVVEIQDDGIGFEPASRPGEDDPRLGLLTMVERAGYAEGRITVDSAPGLGTRVRLHLPLERGPSRPTNGVPPALSSVVAHNELQSGKEAHHVR